MQKPIIQKSMMQKLAVAILPLALCACQSFTSGIDKLTQWRDDGSMHYLRASQDKDLIVPQGMQIRPRQALYPFYRLGDDALATLPQGKRFVLVPPKIDGVNTTSTQPTP